ncbi:hypothetical protein [Demequina muriae]|uniref:DUF5666 domain-containing protein n=1 Tax=Demequina muriae TaxID=3051664 RepID=A0ABT8GII6_9MICO|nr:hypothetical protein [Demequina sp. EGI L300058]MDN4481084.1 hypothetical protein [Demequina sp. EGI L300058]
MRRRAGLVVAAVACGGALSACGSGTAAPERAADAVGAAASIDSDAGGVRVHFAHDAGYEYFEGTIFVLDDDVTVVGAAAAASDIAAGDRLRVWTSACAESFPVQCEVEAIEVLD